MNARDLTAVTLLTLFIVAGGVAPTVAQPAAPPLLKSSLGDIPLHIIENRGVHPDEVRFYVQGRDKSVFFARDGITFALRGEKTRNWAVKLEFVDANEDVVLRGGERRKAVFSYFSGSREEWKTGLPSFAEVAYEELWPGIDLVYRGEHNVLKYEFRVHPGADPKQIRLRYRGATAVETTDTGGLRIETPVASFADERPIAWTEGEGGARAPVDAAFAVDESTVWFKVGDYDSSKPLVIDPAVIVYCGYIGGARHEEATGVAVDGQGCAYIGGWTEPSPTFPAKVGPSTMLPQGVPGAGFVCKVEAGGKQLVYCGWIAGSSWGTTVLGISVDSAGCAYVAGETMTPESRGFPVTVGPDLTHNSLPPKSDAFVAKVNASGTALDYCGYIGGYDRDTAVGITVDAAGAAYVIGETTSADASQAPLNAVAFPTKVGPDLTYNGFQDVFVAKVNPAGTHLDYCGYVGGAKTDGARFASGATGSIAVDPQGGAYVVGMTQSNETTFPVNVGPRLTFQPGAAYDGFVAKVNPAGTALDYCGYFGGGHISGPAYEGVYGVAADAQGHAYLSGTTTAPASRLPLTVGPSLVRSASTIQPIVAKLTPDGSGFGYCGLIDDRGVGASASKIAIDSHGNAVVIGMALGTFPVFGGPQLTVQAPQAGLVAMVDRSGRRVRYSGLIGGLFIDTPYAIAATPSGTAFVAGYALSGEMSGFPVKVGPDLTHNRGGKDAYIAKLAFTELESVGALRPGATWPLQLTATDDAGLVYQLGTSLGSGPIRLGSRSLGLSPDPVLGASTSGALPSVFRNYTGTIDSLGQASGSIALPNWPFLVGITFHTAFITLSPVAPGGIKSISNTVSTTVMP